MQTSRIAVPKSYLVYSAHQVLQKVCSHGGVRFTVYHSELQYSC